MNSMDQTNKKIFNKQFDAVLKRHYESSSDASSTSSEWPQSMTHSSLKRRTKTKALGSKRVRKQKLESYKQEKYAKDLSLALKLWENQAKQNGPDESS